MSDYFLFSIWFWDGNVAHLKCAHRSVVCCRKLEIFSAINIKVTFCNYLLHILWKPFCQFQLYIKCNIKEAARKRGLQLLESQFKRPSKSIQRFIRVWQILNSIFENFPFYPIKSKLLGISTLVSYLNYSKWQGRLFFESH